MAEAADETQRRWRHVQDTVFSTSITQDEQVAAWTRLSQQGLTYVERLLSVPSERLPAVLRYQARGTGAPVSTWPPAGLLPPRRDDVQQLINQCLASQYDSFAGYRMLQRLQQRCPDAPVPQEATALSIGACFPLMAYWAPVRDLAMKLVCMESARRICFSDFDLYIRDVHILRCAGTPGLGKSTAAEALWPALHAAWQSPEFLSAVYQAAGDVCRDDVDKLGRRLANSLTPKRLLVFKLAFNADGLNEVVHMEQGLDTLQFLAARMLYAVMDPSTRLPYPDFLRELDRIHPQLLQVLEPEHVEAFVRRCAGFCDAEPLLMAWVFDEAHALDVSYKERKALPQLLSAFVQFRVGCKADTLPICLVASTIWSCSQLVHTASAKAMVADLQLLPLNSVQCLYIIDTLLERLRKQQQQTQQHQQRLLQLPPDVSARWQQQPGATAAASTAPAAAALPVHWPSLSLQPSARLQQHMQQRPQLPGSVTSLVQLCGGNPRMLCLVLASMGHIGETTVKYGTAALLQCPQTADLRHDVWKLRALASNSIGWSAFAPDTLYGELLAAGFAHYIVQETVMRLHSVCSEVAGYTWQDGERDGLWSLLTSEGRQKFLSDPGVEPVPADSAWQGGLVLYVQMAPIVAAFCKPLAASMMYVHALHDSIHWRQREFQDVGVLAVRCVVASRRFDLRAMTLQQLVYCREAADLQHDSPVLLRLPEHDLAIQHIPTQLDQASFDHLVSQCLSAPDPQPWAFVGPGNFKADGWLVLQLAAPVVQPWEVEGPAAAAEGSPFIIYVSSKQRTSVHKPVTAADILQEREKDVISTTYHHAYVYVTDQYLQPRSSNDNTSLAAHSVFVVSPQEHDALYRGVARLLELMKL